VISLSRKSKRRSFAKNSEGPSLLGLAISLPPLLLVLFFVGLPILIGLTFSLGFTTGPNRVVSIIGQQIHRKNHWWGTLAAYQDVFHDSRFLGDLILTLAVSSLSTILVVLLSLSVALYQRLIGGRKAAVLVTLSIVPLFVPVVISAWAIHTFYGGDGFMRSLFSHMGVNFPTLTSTPSAIVIGSVWTSLPFAILMVSSGMQAIPDSLIEAARDCGASGARIILNILIPLAKTPIIIATSFTAIGILGSFTIPLFLGPNQPTMLGVEISNFFGSYNRPQQSLVMAFIVFFFASGIAITYVWSNVKSARESGRL
jgi:ABC-type spermidine/putrescine transport system permease subunit I